MNALSLEKTVQRIQRAFASELAAHQNGDVILGILSGKKYESGILNTPKAEEELDATLKIVPQRSSELNNFSCILHGGEYRCGSLFKMMRTPTRTSHLIAMLEVSLRSNGISTEHTLYGLSGYSLRYLSETPLEFWRNIDRLTEQITGQKPKTFGHVFREARHDLMRLRATTELFKERKAADVLALVEEGKAQFNITPEGIDKIAHRLEKLEAFWATKIEPRVMELYGSLIESGYSFKDFYT